MSTPANAAAPAADNNAAWTPAPPLTGAAKIAGTVALSLATFMNVLDTSIANVSIPAISGDLGVASSQGTWVITSFAVANAIAVPLTGWLTQRFGQVRLFCLSILLFVIASWLCGIAPNLPTLIAFRVLQGAVAGPMIPLSQSLLLSSYSREKSGIALALWSMTTLVAPVAGPLLGGWITDNISWPWIFFINIPVGIFAAWATWTIYKERDTPTKKLPVDYIGLSLLIIWVGALQIMLDKGKELDWFNSPQIIILAVVAFAGFCFFLAWELFDNEHPIVDLSLFARRNFTSGVIGISIGYGLFFGSVVLLPLWLQTQMGYTATWAGIMTAPVGILAIILTPIVGKNMARLDPRMVASGAFFMFALISFMRSHFNTLIDPWHVVIPTVLQGGAMACFFLPLMSLTLSGLPMSRIPAASGLSNFVRITAGAIGASVVTTLWDSRSAMHHAQLAENVTRYNPNVDTTLSTLHSLGMNDTQSMGYVERLVDAQAHMLGFSDVFWLSGWMFMALAVGIWMAKAPRSSASVDLGGAH